LDSAWEGDREIKVEVGKILKLNRDLVARRKSTMMKINP
jgi:hypothetical protein